MGIEKRQFPRIDHVFKVKYETGRDKSVKTSAKDLSYGGVAFETENLLRSGDMVDLKIYFEELPGEIPAGAKIVRSWTEENKNFAAVEFTDLNEEDHTIIEEYLSYFEEGIIRD
ncbi:MAG: PilZ domain-containing protein [Spirochaetia bacterium]|nr:PilZ domain-containing protein [Spirochaetia bacterium]